MNEDTIQQRRCSVQGCSGKHEARGYCQKHYSRLRKNGELKKIIRITPLSCKVKGCLRRSRKFLRGLCNMHYIRFIRHGDIGSLETQKPSLKSDDKESIKIWMKKMYKINSNGCWEWQGRKLHNYGKMKIDGKEVSSHRVMAFLYHQFDLWSNLHVLHKCDNPPCGNPDHLFIGTNLDNIKDRIKKGRSNSARGESIKSSKLTEEDVREIRRRREQGETYPSIAKDFPIAAQNIRLCCLKIRWKHVT